ncbi:MAG: hypothetical protein CMP51_06130 [Flavobacteriales bacterium]|nr:hypothetical protein [Flavobacteriales bacterium]|tara:strand:- start:403 stop:990 length:588 start_codon:yes stop_codon:yes gene_type:complete
MNNILIPIFILISFFNLCAQIKDDVIFKDYEVLDNDTILTEVIPGIDIIYFKNFHDRMKYNILRRKVLKVYNYALYTKSKLLEIENDLKNIQKRRKKRRYTKKISSFLKEDLSEELKKLTRSEGNILVKLIYRETKISPYSLVKKYRGSANAFFWQTLARLYDNNLKQIYDPVNNREDMFIEHIIINAKLEGRFN